MIGAMVTIVLLLQTSRHTSSGINKLADNVSSIAKPKKELLKSAKKTIWVRTVSPENDENPAYAKRFNEIMMLVDLEERKRQLDALFQEWTSRDAPAAAAFVLTVQDEDLRKESMLRVMQTWGTQDAKSALAWAKDAGFDTNYEREVAMSMACAQVANTNPAEAIRLALQYKFDESSVDLLEGLTARWAETDLSAASDWVIKQPAGEWRDKLIQSIALEGFDAAPDASTQLVLDQIPAGDDRDKAILSLVSKLAFNDSDKALAWVESFPEGTLRESALENLSLFQNRQRADKPF